MPQVDGITATRQLAGPDVVDPIQVLVITTFDLDDAEFARSAVPPAPPPARLDALTEREREILVLVAQGRSNAEIAATLVLSQSTVKTHVGNLLTKLECRDRVQAVVFAYEHGIVRPGAR